MRKLLSSERLVIATHNQGKLREFQEMLAPYVNKVVSAGDLRLSEPEETGSTFVANALIKAHAAAQASQSPSLADDSGLCVKALSGDPGIYSARWAGPRKDFRQAMQRIHTEIGQHPDRSAYFVSVLALAWPDGHHEIFEGRVDGHITWPPKGQRGHGYDPIFVPESESRTFAEMDEIEKNRLSHRGRAVKQLLEILRKT